MQSSSLAAALDGQSSIYCLANQYVPLMLPKRMKVTHGLAPQCVASCDTTIALCMSAVLSCPTFSRITGLVQCTRGSQK
jgi:hypothetical protein